MRFVCVIQCRMGSSRLPGKVLFSLGGETMIEQVVERARAISHVSTVAVATSTAALDDAVADLCRDRNIPVHRGSEHDVLARYVGAAEELGADAVVRVTGDCPLLDPEVSTRVVERYLRGDVDYASNTLDRTWPRGLDTEVVRASLLDLADRESADPADHEHVTPFVYARPERFRLASVKNDEDLSAHRWTVDTAEDLCLVRRVYDALGPGRFGTGDVLALLARNPGWAGINAHVRQKPLRSDG